MKKKLSLIIAVIMLLSVMTPAAIAADADYIAETGDATGKTGDCTWTLQRGGIVIISGNGDMADYSYWGNKAPWLYSADDITKVIIENGVTGIGKETFYLRDKLVDVSIGNTVTEIREAAFRHCTALQRIVIPDSMISINESAFQYCHKLTDVDLGTSLTTIGKDAFYQCNSLKNITIPASVTNIESHALGYTLIIGDSRYSKISGFTITGYNNTEAQRYAEKNGFTFISLGDLQTEPTVLPTEPSTDEYVLGDADGSGEVDMADATVIQRVATMIAVPYDEEQLMCADVDGDESLTIVDATFIQRFSTRIAVPYPIGEAIE